MNKIYFRKIILLGAVVVLALIFAIQTIVSSRSSEKIFKFDSDFDAISISSEENGLLELKRDGNVWKIGDEEVEEIRAERFVSALKQIKTLGVVSKSDDENVSERYGFSDSQKISVKASSAGKDAVSLEIGKDAAGGQQNYVKLNGSKEIYLASGALKSTFNVKKDEIVKKPEEKQPESTETPVKNSPVEDETAEK